MLLVGKNFEIKRDIDVYIINKGMRAEAMAHKLSSKLRKYDVITEIDVSGSSISKQFKKANKCKTKSIIVIGEEEAMKNQFKIRLFSNNNDNEKIIDFDDNEGLEKWLKNIISNYSALK